MTKLERFEKEQKIIKRYKSIGYVLIAQTDDYLVFDNEATGNRCIINPITGSLNEIKIYKSKTIKGVIEN